MSILVDELARMAGPNSHKTITATVQRWEDKIRERIRLEMALKLADDSGWGRQRVGVVVSDGLPVALAPYEQSLTTQLAEVAGMYRPDLQAFEQGAEALDQLLRRLADLDLNWANRAAAEMPGIGHLQSLVRDLLELAKKANLISTLKQIDQDVLGAYFPLGKKPKGGGPPVIELYWPVIGAIAKSIDVDVEGLTLVVLVHELAHAYSHLGADTDGSRWVDVAFCNAEVTIKEGIAQYYTEKIVGWLQQRNLAAPYQAYSQLLEIQSLPYHIHEKWSKDFSPESVRAAIIECRNNQLTSTEQFVDLMSHAKHRLTRR
jgi:hypothetical protein